MTIKRLKNRRIVNGVRCQFNPLEIEVIRTGLTKISVKEIRNLNTGVGKAINSILHKLSK